MIVYYAELRPARASDGAEQVIRLATRPHVNRVDGAVWRPFLTVPLRRNTQLFDGQFSDQVPDYGSLEWAWSKGEDRAAVNSLLWDGRTVKVWRGTETSTATSGMTLVFSGLARDIASDSKRATVQLRGPDWLLDKPLLTKTYAGTGGEEGPADLAGTLKPMLLGTAMNLEPVYLDQGRGIFQYHAYGPFGAQTPGITCNAVYDSGSKLGTSIGDFADYAALSAATVPAGRFATCNALGIARHGGDITGILTIDAQGAAANGRPGDIIRYLMQTHGGLAESTQFSPGSTTDLNSKLPNTTLDLYLENQESILRTCQNIMLTLGGYVTYSDDGVVLVGLVRKGGASSLTINRQNIADLKVRATSPPLWKRRMGYNRSHRVHSYSEVRTPKEITPRGAWSSGTVYQYYDKVEHGDSSWIYVATEAGDPATPGTNSAVWQLFSTNGAPVFDQATAPTSPVQGTLWRNSTNGLFSWWNGSAWVAIADITADHTAAGIAGQGALATLNDANFYDDVVGAPLSQLVNVTDAAALGFNPAFDDWPSGTLPVGWTVASGPAANFGKETTIRRTGRFSIKMVGDATNTNVYDYRTVNNVIHAPADAIVSGWVDAYVDANVGGTGSPLILVDVLYDAAGTSVRHAFYLDKTKVGLWQRVPFTARAPAGQRIFGIRIYKMASWTGAVGGAWQGTVFFDNIDFQITSPDLDNNQVYFDGNYLRESLGGALATRANFRTDQGTASGIANQGAFATLNSAGYGSSYLTGFGTLAPRADVYFDSTFIRETSGGVNATRANFRTDQGTAAGFLNQGALATRGNVTASLMVGTDYSNIELDPDFQDEGGIWALNDVPQGAAYDTSTDVTAAANLNAKKGVRSASGNGTTSQTGTHFLHNPTLASYTPVEPNKVYRVSLRALYKAGFTGIILFRTYFYNNVGGYVGGLDKYGTDFRTTAAAAQTIETITHQGKVPATAVYARTIVYTFWSTTLANAGYAVVAKPTLVRVPAFNENDLYDSLGFVTQALYRTPEGTASGIANQGAFATLNSAAYGSSYLTGFGGLAGRNNARLGYELMWANGTSTLTEAQAVTAQGTAAGIANQGALATRGTVDVAAHLVDGAVNLVPAQVRNYRRDVNSTSATALISYGIGSSYRAGGNITGALQIKIPLLSSSMVRFRINIYEYSTNRITTYEVGGYTRTEPNIWVNAFASAIGKNVATKAVRFCGDGTNKYVVIGEVNTVWYYPQVTVTEIQAGYAGVDDRWEQGWATTFVTALPSRVDSTVTNPVPGDAILGNNALRQDGTTLVTDATAITALGTASGIVNQGALATKGSVAYGTADVTGFAALAARADVRFGYEVKQSNGTTTVTDAAAITSLGTASGIAGQGALATRGDVVPGLVRGIDFANVQLDPDFQDEAVVWQLSAGSWDTSTETTAAASLNARKSGKTAVGNGTTSQASHYPYLQRVTHDGLTPVEGGKRYRLDLRALYKAGYTGTLVVYWVFYNSAMGGAGLTATKQGADYRTAASPTADTLETISHTVVAPAGATYVRHYVLAYWSTTKNNAGYALMGKPTIVRLPQVNGNDLYDSAGYVAQAAYKTLEGTAAAITGQGALAKKNAVDLATTEVLNKNLNNIADTTSYARVGAAHLTSGQPKLQIAGSGVKLGDQRNIHQITSMNRGYKWTGAISYTATDTGTATISVGAATVPIGSINVSYNAMSVGTTGTAGTTVTYFLYFDDPNYTGGTPTLIANTSGTAVYQNNGRVYVGSCTVSYPSSGSGGTSGGGDLSCVHELSYVRTLNRGWLMANELRPGDLLRVLTEDGKGAEWQAMTGMEVSEQPCYLLRSASGHSLRCSASTPMTLRDGSTVLPHELNGAELAVEDDEGGFWWEPVRAEPTSPLRVCHIHCGGRTFAAGNTRGKAIFTHNEVKP